MNTNKETAIPSDSTGAKPLTLMPDDAKVLDELNAEARVILGFILSEKVIKAELPEGWEASPAVEGPSKGANLLVIFADRHLVQNADGTEKTANQLAVLAIPAKHAKTGRQGVIIAFGLSGSENGAPGPYGVFDRAKASIERTLRSMPGGEREAIEEWEFVGENGDILSLTVQYKRGVPIRSDNVTRAYSAKNPSFYRIYIADQGADVLRNNSVDVGLISGPEFRAHGPRLNALFKGSEQRAISVISIPWTVRRAYLPKNDDAASLFDENRDPTTYTKPYSVLEETMWIDSPSRPRENGWLQAGDTVWLDKDLPEEATGMRLVKLSDGKLRYATQVENLVKG